MYIFSLSNLLTGQRNVEIQKDKILIFAEKYFYIITDNFTTALKEFCLKIYTECKKVVGFLYVIILIYNTYVNCSNFRERTHRQSGRIYRRYVFVRKFMRRNLLC